MKKDKEYPATHSMSTQWFAVDIDGNVAVLDFDDNGPIPNVAPIEETADDVIMGYLAKEKTNGLVTYLNYTPEQVLDITKDISPVTESSNLHEFDAIFRIDKEKLSRFLEIVNSNPETEYRGIYCLSEELGVYAATLYHFPKDGMKALIAERIILAQMHYGSWLGDTMEEVEMKTFPFYIYKQPYWTGDLIAKLSTPSHPVHISQYKDKYSKLAIRLPFRFKDKDSFQIAEYFNSVPYAGKMVKYMDRNYHWLPKEDGTDAFFLESIIPEKMCGSTPCRCSLCFKNKEYKFSACCCASRSYCDYPTAMVISDVYPQRGSTRYKFSMDSVLHWNAFDVCILQGLPSTKSHLWQKEIEEMYPESELAKFFVNCKSFIEQCVSELKPYVLIVFPQAMRLLSTQYKISDHKIEIAGYILPIFTFDEIDENYDEIRKLVTQPYRGIILPRILDPKNLPDGAVVYD